MLYYVGRYYYYLFISGLFLFLTKRVSYILSDSFIMYHSLFQKVVMFLKKNVSWFLVVKKQELKKNFFLSILIHKN